MDGGFFWYILRFLHILFFPNIGQFQSFLIAVSGLTISSLAHLVLPLRGPDETPYTGHKSFQNETHKQFSYPQRYPHPSAPSSSLAATRTSAPYNAPQENPEKTPPIMQPRRTRPPPPLQFPLPPISGDIPAKVPLSTYYSRNANRAESPGQDDVLTEEVGQERQSCAYYE